MIFKFMTAAMLVSADRAVVFREIWLNKATKTKGKLKNICIYDLKFIQRLTSNRK